MSIGLFKISGGKVYDPTNGVDGQVRDIWIEHGRIVAPPTDPQMRPARTLDATGLVVMPGGIDMHCHIAGPKVNVARRLRPDEKRAAEPFRRTSICRSGTLGSVPSTFATGYKYAALGYTTAFDAAIAPISARHVHQQFADTPCLDKGFYVLMGNNHYLMDALAAQEPNRVREFVAWLLAATKGYAPKLVNPGGIEAWKQRAGGNVSDLDEAVDHFGVTPRQIIEGVARAAAELKLPHRIHVHANNLGLPGNWTTTLATLEALEGHGGHLTHIQFHSYGGGDEEGSFCSQVPALAQYVNAHPSLSVDVGQVLFGGTTSMTGDGPLGYYLSQLNQSRWYSNDIEMESGCGISPIRYKNKNLVHALQWAIGLEWYLLVDDPWRVAMSTDHPNGGSFLAYPQIIRLLMDRTWRKEVLRSVHPQLRERCSLADLDREYSLSEICIITRSAPARLLGLTHKGHLGVGADADITLYSPHDNPEIMFELPRYVIKEGQILVDGGEIRQAPGGKTLHVAPQYDPAIEADIRAYFEKYSSIQFGNYAVDDDYLDRSEIVACE